MSRAVAVAGVTVVGLALVIAAAGALKDEGKREVNVELSMTGNECKAVDSVDKLGGSWARSKLLWHVTNHCTTSQVVGMQDFKKRHDDGTFDPLENDLVKPYPPTSQPIAPNTTSDVETHLRKFKFWDTYKYNICAGADAQNLQSCIDPDVDVWPF